jgi:hypothetical protein
MNSMATTESPTGLSALGSLAAVDPAGLLVMPSTVGQAIRTTNGHSRATTSGLHHLAARILRDS